MLGSYPYNNRIRLGEQFARFLSGAGARVILAARRIEKLNTLAAEFFADLEQAGEKIDICVNNAGITVLTPIFEEDDNDNFELTVQTNLMGVWYVTKAAASHIKTHGIHGSIINIVSINGDTFPYKEATAYPTSKAVVIHMAKSLVTDLPQYKIRINTINPGPVQSDLLGSPNKHDPDFWKNKIPSGFIAEPSDLDGLIPYLASNNASKYVTGACIISQFC